MSFAAPKPVPDVEGFSRLSRKKQRRRLEDWLGHFLDRLQVEGRDPDIFEAYRFRNALDALGEGNYDQAYEGAVALLHLSAPEIPEIAISGERLSRDDMASGLRHLIDRVHTKYAH